MGFDFKGALDSAKNSFDSAIDGTKEVAETAQKKTSEFHETNVSKVLPDCGKYGEAAEFAAGMVPGVDEYNAIREGDWTAFAISAGLDVGGIVLGAFSAGAGYAAVKGGAKAAAKAVTKKAVKEVAEAGTEKAIKEAAEAGAKKAAKEIVEASAEKAAKEVVESRAEKVVKETAEAGAKKAAKEIAEAGAEKTAKEIAEAGAEKLAKETAEAGAEKVTKEIAEAGTEKAAKEVAEAGVEKATKEVAEEGIEKAAKETAEAGAEKVAKEVAEEGTEKTAKEIAENTEKTILKVGDKIDKTRFPEYLDDIEKITKREIPTNQKELLEKALTENEYVKLSPEDVEDAAYDFAKKKSDLILEWEKKTGQTWPRYTEDVYNEAGNLIRRKGQLFDAHHIIEKSVGGPNEWWNLHPARFPSEHQQGIHAAESLASKIFG